ncbi:carbohydrate-binding module family 14 protein [Streptomyces niveiscabiei]|uniref:Carbohydrate-binding module family 14 protein n=1 Tax=Streptomyces niveiscabiei TaxID=164115 RepID=A0ABW9HSE9_9ACTN
MKIRALCATVAATAGALAFVLGTASPSSALPSDYCYGAPDGLYSYPSVVQLYVECRAGVAVVQSCPSGLNFNAHGRYCDWPASADPGYQVFPPNYRP